ncbi:hypothetical protein [Hoeflea sp.]|uniref:hypothetical protein n=1 Tax=Hoeflea sp. TaxID=1940281 RepID=UPI0025BD1170|nr:hypothetical protein [Hoeflea sp.]
MFGKPKTAHTLTVLMMAAVASLSVAFAAEAGEADVVAATFARAADGTYRFDVSVRHADAGWDHYSDKWQVIGPDGTVLGERVLAHPHDTEQPFTRSQSGIVIPQGVATVTIRAHDKVHGWGGAELVVELGS